MHTNRVRLTGERLDGRSVKLTVEDLSAESTRYMQEFELVEEFDVVSFLVESTRVVGTSCEADTADPHGFTVVRWSCVPCIRFLS